MIGPYLIYLIFIHSVSWGAPLHVVIDPGHGGRDRGATDGPHVESQLTLEISRHLKTLLDADSNFKANLVRTSDETLSLEDRAKRARGFSGDVFISIHVNTARTKNAHGAEFYFQNQLPPDEESAYLANLENQKQLREDSGSWPLFPVSGTDHFNKDVVQILKDLQRNFRLQRSSQLARSVAESWTGSKRSQENLIRQAPFYVVSQVNMPSALIEVGYISNPKEVSQIEDKEYQQNLAQGLLEGLKNYKRVVDKSQ